MINNSPDILASRQLDPSILNWLEVTSNIFLLFAAGISTLILSGWFIPPMSAILFESWALMQATTAFLILSLSIILALNKQKNNHLFYFVSRFFAIIYIVLVAVALLEHWYSYESVLGKFLVANTMQPMVHPTSIQSTSCFLVLALTLFIDYSSRGRLGHIFDVLILLLVALNLLYLAGYIYKASSIIEVSSAILISPQTLLCIALLTFVQAARRAPFGWYVTLASKGIAGQTARMVLPFSVIFTYVLILIETHTTRSEAFDSLELTAVIAVTSALILIIVVIFLSHKIDALERRLRSMSVTDELTGVYNLRGFYQYGKQVIQDVKRYPIPLTVLFIDADGLKIVNDTQGHDAGSQLLCDIVTLLRENLRESDLVSRVGGDEFAVIVHGHVDEVDLAIQRINKATDEINTSGNKPYKIGFSIGKVVIDPHSSESLEDLLSRADAAMYENKKENRAADLQR